MKFKKLKEFADGSVVWGLMPIKRKGNIVIQKIGKGIGGSKPWIFTVNKSNFRTEFFRTKAQALARAKRYMKTN